MQGFSIASLVGENAFTVIYWCKILSFHMRINMFVEKEHVMGKIFSIGFSQTHFPVAHKVLLAGTTGVLQVIASLLSHCHCTMLRARYRIY